ncbi:hypothetical protein MRB53_037814 [Persea americana]|nr:hypothetical protein MRB53_037814 [Persea americana]
MSAPQQDSAMAVPQHHPVTVAVDPVALVVTECITVTSAMRKHTRWAHSSVAAILGGGAASARQAPATARASYSDKGGERRASGVANKDGKITDDITLASRWGLAREEGPEHAGQPAPLCVREAAQRPQEMQRCVIRSSSTSAPITSLALIAITKFFAYGMINHESPKLPLAMQSLSSAVTHCRFEASDSATDEIVLLRILRLMEIMISGSGGAVLGDESMCEMMETGISMCCQTRLSELLRREAEISMVNMCRTIFQRLKTLEVTQEDEQKPRRESHKDEVDGVRMEPAITGELMAMGKENFDKARASSQDLPRDKGGTATPSLNGTADQSQVDLTTLAETDTEADIKPYGLPSIRELFRVLVDLLDPHNKQHNDTMRVMALRIVDVALEVAGPSIASHPSLASLAKDTLCRHIFQLVRSENIAILNESLRVAGTLLSTCRSVLKLQQELFLSYLVACLHPRVPIPQEPGIDPALYEGVPQAPGLVRAASAQNVAAGSGRATPVPVRDRQKLGMEGGTRKPDAREAMVESVGALVRIPSFMVELFVNYDCEVDRGDLCLDMIGLLARNAFPDAATWSTTNVPPLCLDSLLGYIQSIADRLDDKPVSNGYPSRQQLLDQRARKKVIIQGVTKFNENQKAGLAFLASEGVIENLDDPAHIVRFLRATTRVDKRVLGEFISKKSNEHLLNAYMETFDFSELRVDEALRQLLNSFRLPGESPLIERIVNVFAARYCASADTETVADKDAVYVLTYAVIMLNTDQHNPRVKQQGRMQLADFQKNLRGVNGGKDFEPSYLADIYESIKTNEIVLAEEHDNKQSFDHAWKELLVKIQSTNDFTICNTNLFDADMFAATWKPVIATLTYVFLSATDDTVFNRIMIGFDQCAQIAYKYGHYEALDRIIFCLSSITTLSSTSIPNTALNTEVAVSERKVMVSETAVKFGRDPRAQLATVLLFRAVIGHEAAVRDGWNNLILILLNLFVNSLVSPAYQSLASYTNIPPIPMQSPAQVIERGPQPAEGGGLFSAFTSYVSSFANDEPPEPSDQEIEYTLFTFDCVNACALEAFFSNISRLPLSALKVFVGRLLDRLPDDTSPRVIVVKPDLPAPTPVRANGQKAKTSEPVYDPSIVFILELATILAARDPETTATIGKDVADALQTVVRDATHMHPVVSARAVYYLLSFLRASHDLDFVRVPVVLHAISKFDESLLNQSSSFIIEGLALCLNGPPSLRNEIVNSPDFWDVLKVLHSIPATAQSVFDTIVDIVEGTSPVLNAENFGKTILLLNDFAAAGSVGAAAEQQLEDANRDPAARKGSKAGKPKKAKLCIRLLSEYRTSSSSRISSDTKVRMPRSWPFRTNQITAWTTYWTPPFRTLTTHSLNPCRQLRVQAIASLQRLLLSPSLSAPSTAPLDLRQTTSLFTDVLFPLVQQLLKPEVSQTDPVGMVETRLQAAILCCKVYLRYLDTLLTVPSAKSRDANGDRTPPHPTPQEIPMSPLSPQDTSSIAELSSNSSPTNPAHIIDPSTARAPDVGVKLWSRILSMLERLVKNNGAGNVNGNVDGLEEAVPEGIKNILLVMAAGDYLAPPWDEKGRGEPADRVEGRYTLQERLWNVSTKRLERYLPELVPAVFPAPEEVQTNTEKEAGTKTMSPGDVSVEDAPAATAPAASEGPDVMEEKQSEEDGGDAVIVDRADAKEVAPQSSQA